ncbi:hypothetical protein K9U40_05805 [Xanthobacter autotrophicus]|uniref:hypothetical protein n=1 Tax=Xanthobacter TaxID=279 RepID=UPI0024AA7205|nr:hypothetical protein [Xanthobacter autotrophicus]MDI4663843.1 hypothetical protein [Xanthobacter autotrophicus]
MGDAITLSDGRELSMTDIVRVPCAVLEPFLTARRWYAKFREITSDYDVMGFSWNEDLTPAETVSAHMREQARAIHRRVPDVEVINAAQSALSHALRTPATPEETVLIVSGFLSARVNLSNERYPEVVERLAATLVNALDFEPFSAAALAAGCQRWNETERFLPEGAELLDKVREAHGQMRRVEDRLPDLFYVGFKAWQLLRDLGEVQPADDGFDDEVEYLPASALPCAAANVVPLHRMKGEVS